jgi:hypothetical protein
MTEKKEKKEITIVVPVKIDEERIRNLLVSAFEGGIGYWGRIMEYTYPPGFKKEDFDNWHTSGRWESPRYIEVPMMEGGKVWLHDAEESDSRWPKLPQEEKEKWCLTREKFFKVMLRLANMTRG